MSIDRVITHGGVTIDLESVKGFKATNVGYIPNPNTAEFELNTFNDSMEVEYRTYESAKQYMEEWANIWQQYLIERDELNS